MMKIASVTVAMALLAACSLERNKLQPREEAEQWVKEMGLAVKGIACATADTDRDGYVSCELNLGEGRTDQIQCGAPGAYAEGSGCAYVPVSGCKKTKPNVIVQERAQ